MLAYCLVLISLEDEKPSVSATGEMLRSQRETRSKMA